MSSGEAPKAPIVETVRVTVGSGRSVHYATKVIYADGYSEVLRPGCGAVRYRNRSRQSITVTTDPVTCKNCL